MSERQPQPAAPFHACSFCRQGWLTWEDFLLDPGLRLRGLQVVEHLPEANLLVFEHLCGTSVSVKASRLRPHLLPDADHGATLPNLFGAEECAGHCGRLEDLSVCDRPCINARDRRLIARVIDLNRASP